MRYAVENGDVIEFEGHLVRFRVRYRECGRKGCRGCPHPSTVVEVVTPSNRRRELWAEPPASSGRRAGAPRTRRVQSIERGPRR